MKNKNKITDDIEDARNIVQMVGKAIKEGTTDKNSALDNLARAMQKLDSARYHLNRE